MDSHTTIAQAPNECGGATETVRIAAREAACSGAQRACGPSSARGRYNGPRSLLGASNRAIRIIARDFSHWRVLLWSEHPL